MKIGEVEKVKWYILEDDRVVSFHTAFEDCAIACSVCGGGQYHDKQHTFFSERQILPSLTARKLGITYGFMRNATDKEAESAIAEKGLRVKGVVEL